MTSPTGSAQDADLLRRELDHRLGNIFALFQALITASRDGAESLEEFEGDLRNRVEALSTSQSAGMADREDRLNLGELCALTLRPFGAENSRVLSGPRVTLGAEATSALALALHELATNAVKHGALSSPEGQIALRWTLDEEGAVEISWVERGGPPARPPRDTSFGTRLIHLMLEQRLGGTVDFDFAETGLRGHIRLPATQVEDAARAPGGATTDRVRKSRDAVLDGCAVLIAEDDPIIALDFEDMARKMGARMVHRVTNSRDALLLLDDKRLEVAIVDLTLADGTADRLIARLDHARIPTVAVTGSSGSDRDSGRSAILRKPFSDSELAFALSCANN